MDTDPAPPPSARREEPITGAAPSHDQHRRVRMQALRSETEKRHGEWRAALEPEQGCSFEVYIQNPYIRPPEEENAYKARFKVSRPPPRRPCGQPPTPQPAPRAAKTTGHA